MVYREEPEPEIISHLLGDTPNTLRFVLATEVPPETLVAAVRDTVARVDARIPFVLPRTMEQVAADELVRDRFLMTLLGVFALAALVLAAVGVYGVAAQGARARTREIGIRMALGATGEQIVGQLVRGGGMFVLIGLLLGFAGAVAASRLIAGFLFGIEPLDPATWLAVGLVLAAVGLVASYLPARAAARTDPAKVLHIE
jgi:putative ABC transport system permease protein